MYKKLSKLNFGVKIISLCIPLSFVCLMSCKKGQNNTSSTLPKLSQTSWKGQLTMNENSNRSQSDINIDFGTETTGYFVLKNTDESLKNSYSTDSPFSYKIDKKILLIDFGTKNILLGDWWLISSKKDELVMVRDISNPKEADTLKINKNY